MWLPEQMGVSRGQGSTPCDHTYQEIQIIGNARVMQGNTVGQDVGQSRYFSPIRRR